MNDNWLPMKDAPTDGARIILYREGYAEDMAICWRDNYLNEWRPVHGGTFRNPTGWQHRPAAPTQKVTT